MRDKESHRILIWVTKSLRHQLRQWWWGTWDNYKLLNLTFIIIGRKISEFSYYFTSYLLSFRNLKVILWLNHNVLLFSFLFVGTVTEGKNLYISRALGNDTWSCDKSKPCKTISRAVELASSGDHILLAGNNTDRDPYTCRSMSPEHSGVQINKSLSIMGYGSPMPHIQCSKRRRFAD